MRSSPWATGTGRPNLCGTLPFCLQLVLAGDATETGCYCGALQHLPRSQLQKPRRHDSWGKPKKLWISIHDGFVNAALRNVFCPPVFKNCELNLVGSQLVRFLTALCPEASHTAEFRWIPSARCRINPLNLLDLSSSPWDCTPCCGFLNGSELG